MSHVLGALLASSHLLAQAWTRCLRANASSANFVIDRSDDAIFVAFSGAQATASPSGLGRGFFKPVSLYSDTHELFVPLGRALCEDSNPYAVPMAMGIYKQPQSPLGITTSTIIKRIVANHEAYQCNKSHLANLSYKQSCLCLSILLALLTFSIGWGDIKHLKLEWLRSQIGLVTQEPTLLSLSIKDNIAYGRSATSDQIEEAAKTIHAHDFITSLEMGYETQVGRTGLTLTKEQKIKISIARVVLSILLFFYWMRSQVDLILRPKRFQVVLL
ncbi:hypothetical protein ZIOFF_057015 [Zingiber officinale]|uniref:Uncharacterized protein n=1 Tax=Zingiber officinale TaxID=94328 RepID=A0A8J5KPZ8_ZINOF|nr:hypothetical protein ZIOFF_057015 [Zingiber officinale]